MVVRATLDNARPSNFPFTSVDVDLRVRGKAIITWSLHPEFKEPRPYLFSLQKTETPANEESWQTVGSSVKEAVVLEDQTPDINSLNFRLFYRVTISVPASLKRYVSPPVPITGKLTGRDWTLIREIIRKERVRQKFAGSPFWLLKRLYTGEDCECVDKMLDVSRDPSCKSCYGTGIKGGYVLYDREIRMDTTTEQKKTTMTPQKGTDLQIVVAGRYSDVVPVDEGDVFVQQGRDKRYYVRGIRNLAEYKGYPIVQQLELHLIPPSEVIYEFPVPR